jgi:hypothetical protein
VSLDATLLWPLDGRSEQITKRLLAMLERREWNTRRIRLLAPPVTPADELRTFLLTLKKDNATSYEWNEFRIVFLAAAGHESAFLGLQEVEKAAAALPSLIATAGHIEFVAFTPVAESPQEERKLALRFVRALEQMAGQTRNLEAVFVHEDTIPGPESEKDEVSFDTGLGELLWRTLFADGVSDLIRSAARTAVSLHQKTGAGKCSFTTAGVRTLVFEPSITRQRLAGRLAKQLVQDALVVSEFEPDQLAPLVQQADDVIDSLAARCEAALPAPSRTALAPETRSDREPAEILSAWQQRVDNERMARRDQMEIVAPDPAPPLDDVIRSAITHPLHFGAAARLGRLLAGESIRLDDSQPDRVTGVLRFHDAFVVHWWQGAIEAWVQAALGRVGATALPARSTAEDLPAWIGRLMATASGTIEAPNAARAMALKWLRDAFLAVANQPSATTQADQLPEPIAALADLYRPVAERAMEMWRAALAEQKQAADDLEIVNREFSGLAKQLFGRAERKQRTAEIQDRIDAAEGEASSWQAALALINETLGTFTTQIALPLGERLSLEAKLHRAVAARVAAIQDFMAELVRQAGERSQAADAQAGATQGTRHVLGEPGILDTLFGNGVHQQTPSQLLDSALAMEAASGVRTTWARFAHLPAYLGAGQAGASALVDRLFEFGLRLFEMVLGLGVPEALSAGGSTKTATALRESVERALTLFPLASAQVAQLAIDGKWQPTFIVRCPHDETTSLAQGLVALAPGPCRFLSSEGRIELDLTCVIAGFPGSIIHALTDPALSGEATSEP